MANLSDSNTNTDWWDSPSDGPDGYRGEDELAEDALTCPMCGDTFTTDCNASYCSAQCRIDAENDR